MIEKGILITVVVIAAALGAIRSAVALGFFAIAGSAFLPWLVAILLLTLAGKLAKKGISK
tara:strand:- start:377 stop:556 length:180 start_codon:yes stop_codon:yes gene_type:complete